jgi:hypothetical protein
MLRYFESNQHSFNDNFTRNLYGTGSGEAISEEKVPTNEEIARILEYLPIHAKALTLLLASSGIRIGEAMKLTWNDIDLESQPVKINLRAEYTKTKKKRITFISKEAENILREFIDYIPKYIDKNEGYKTRIDKDFKGKVFPFSATTFRKLWNGALKDAGLYEQDPKTNRVSLRPHNLRKFFRTYGKWRNPDIAEALMGHISGLKAIYARLDQAEEILLEGYLEAEPNLSIYHNSKTILELREKVDKQSEDIQELVTNLSLKNVRLENRLEEQQVKLEGTIETNQKLLETIITQGSLMENMQSQLNILSKRVFDRNKVEAKERLKKFEKEDIVRMTNEDGVVKFQIKSI